MWVVTRSPCETCVDSPSAMGLPSGVRRTRKPCDTPSLYRTATDSAISAVDESREVSKRRRCRIEPPQIIHSWCPLFTALLRTHEPKYVQKCQQSVCRCKIHPVIQVTSPLTESAV